MLQLLVVDLCRLEHGGIHSRQHAEHVLERPHLLHLLHRAEEVLEIEALLRRDLLREALGLFLVDRSLRLFHQREDVSLLEDPAREAVGVERLERLELLADTDVLDRRLGDSVDRQRRAAAGVAVHLGQDDAGDAEGVVESPGDPDRVLSRHAVGHEKNFMGRDGGLEPPELVHHLVVDLEPARSVDDDRPPARLAGRRRCRRERS